MMKPVDVASQSLMRVCFVSVQNDGDFFFLSLLLTDRSSLFLCQF